MTDTGTATTFEEFVADWCRANGWRDLATVTSVVANGQEGGNDSHGGYGDTFDVTIHYTEGTGRATWSSVSGPEAAALWNHVVAAAWPK